MLNIGLVTPYDLAPPGGVNAQIRAQARALRALGHRVVVYGPSSHGNASRDEEVHIGRAFALYLGGTVSGLALNPFLGAPVRKALRQERFDILHLHEPLTPFLPFAFFGETTAVRVGTFHVHRERGHRGYALGSMALKRYMGRLDHRIAVSEAALSTISRYFPGQYDVIPNGVDVARFQRPTQPPAELADGRPSVLFLGRIEQRKGLAHLIQAMARVRAAIPGAHLVVVGDGPDRRHCESLARKLREDVTFVGRVPDDLVPPYLQAADVVCSPATGGESFGVVLLEAMAAGTALVASDIEGYAAVVGPAESALLVQPGEPLALGEALARLLLDEGLRRRLGECGQAAVRDYDWRIIGRRLLDVYDGLLEQREERTPAFA